MNFYKIPTDLSNDLQVVVVSDIDDPYCPMPKESLFLNLAKDRDKINYLIEKLQKNGEVLL